MRSDFNKTRLFHLRNVEKPPHPQFPAQRAPEGQKLYQAWSKFWTKRQQLIKILFEGSVNRAEKQDETYAFLYRRHSTSTISPFKLPYSYNLIWDSSGNNRERKIRIWSLNCPPGMVLIYETLNFFFNFFNNRTIWYVNQFERLRSVRSYSHSKPRIS